MAKFKPKYPLVWVEWVDSCELSINAEVEEHEIPDLQNLIQVGHLIKETDDAISVAGCYKPKCKSYDYVITIPRFAILKIRRLKI
jgi:hypothetical protein